MEKYGILFAGCINLNPDNCALRYLNDLEYMYSVLINKLQYNPNNIDILLADGKRDIGMKFYGSKISTIPGIYTNFRKTIQKYRNLSVDDQLFIMISNHGGPLPNGKAVINCFTAYEPIDITTDEFKNILNELVCKKIIVMGQCFGGNFLNLNINNSIIISANLPNLFSYAVSDIEHDEFLYHFTAYLDGQYPNSIRLNNFPDIHNKTVYNTFTYALQNDRLANGSLPHLSSESPQIIEYNLDSNNTYI